MSTLNSSFIPVTVAFRNSHPELESLSQVEIKMVSHTDTPGMRDASSLSALLAAKTLSSHREDTAGLIKNPTEERLQHIRKILKGNSSTNRITATLTDVELLKVCAALMIQEAPELSDKQRIKVAWAEHRMEEFLLKTKTRFHDGLYTSQLGCFTRLQEIGAGNQSLTEWQMGMIAIRSAKLTEAIYDRRKFIDEFGCSLQKIEQLLLKEKKFSDQDRVSVEITPMCLVITLPGKDFLEATQEGHASGVCFQRFARIVEGVEIESAPPGAVVLINLDKSNQKIKPHEKKHSVFNVLGETTHLIFSGFISAILNSDEHHLPEQYELAADSLKDKIKNEILAYNISPGNLPVDLPKLFDLNEIFNVFEASAERTAVLGTEVSRALYFEFLENVQKIIRNTGKYQFMFYDLSSDIACSLARQTAWKDDFFKIFEPIGKNAGENVIRFIVGRRMLSEIFLDGEVTGMSQSYNSYRMTNWYSDDKTSIEFTRSKFLSLPFDKTDSKELVNAADHYLLNLFSALKLDSPEKNKIIIAEEMEAVSTAGDEYVRQYLLIRLGILKDMVCADFKTQMPISAWGAKIVSEDKEVNQDTLEIIEQRSSDFQYYILTGLVKGNIQVDKLAKALNKSPIMCKAISDGILDFLDVNARKLNDFEINAIQSALEPLRDHCSDKVKNIEQEISKNILNYKK